MVKQVMPGTSAAEFHRQMEGQAFTLVDFYAQWCGPCKMIAPQVDQLAMLHPHITFLKVDVDQCPDISGASSIAAMPTFILYARGREMSRVTGADPAKLRQLLQQATSMSASAPQPMSFGAPSAMSAMGGARMYMGAPVAMGYPNVAVPMGW
jgi:thioredoxin 1